MTKKVNLKINEGYNEDISYYSKILKQPFDSLAELREAEAAYYEAEKAKADKAAQKKADAKKVEDAFKALNQARRDYKENLNQLTTDYAEGLKELKAAFEADKNRISNALADAETKYSNELKEFTNKYENYHVTLKDGDFETTISHDRQNPVDMLNKGLSMFDWIFGF